MCAFGAHSLKEIAPVQLKSVARLFLKGTGRKLLPKADKNQLVRVLAPLLLEVAMRDGANINDLVRNDVTKEGTFSMYLCTFLWYAPSYIHEYVHI